MGQSSGSLEGADERQKRPLLGTTSGGAHSSGDMSRIFESTHGLPVGFPTRSNTEGSVDLPPRGDPLRSYAPLAALDLALLPSQLDAASSSTFKEDGSHRMVPRKLPNGNTGICSGDSCHNMAPCMPHRWCESEVPVEVLEIGQFEKLPGLTSYAAVHADMVLLRHVDDMLTPNGGVYTGQVGLDGRPHGEGVQKYVDGALYSGQWEEGAAHGQGELRVSNGKEYKGSWKAGLKHGQGREQYDGGSEYVGNFQKGHRHGHGTLTLGNGSDYQGDFAEGEFHGEGQLRWPDGRVYVGQWQCGLMHGFGKYDWPDGKSHSGHYQEDRRHGAGVFHWPDGSLCKGRWQDGKLHGSGTYVDAQGVSKHGRWEHGERKYWTK